MIWYQANIQLPFFNKAYETIEADEFALYSWSLDMGSLLMWVFILISNKQVTLRYVKPVIKPFIVDERVWMNSHIRVHRHPNRPDIWSGLASTFFWFDGILRYVSFKIKQKVLTWGVVMCKFKRSWILNLFLRELGRGLRYFKMVIFCVLIALMVHKHLLGEYLSNFSASFFILTFWRKLMIFLLADFSVYFFWKLFLLVALIFVLFLFLADFLGLYLNFWQINFKLSGKCFTVYFFLISVVPRPIWCT